MSCVVHNCVFLSRHIVFTENKLCNCLHVKGLLAQNKCNILNLSDWNRTRNNNHLVCKLLNHSAKLADCVIRVNAYNVYRHRGYLLLKNPFQISLQFWGKNSDSTCLKTVNKIWLTPQHGGRRSQKRPEFVDSL